MKTARIRKLHTDARLPKYHTDGSVGFDFHVLEPTTIPAMSAGKIRTGLSIATPEGYMLSILPRSSTFKNYGLIMPNSMGVIDQDYSGDEDEIFISVLNLFPMDCELEPGVRVAQGVFIRIGKVLWQEVEAMGASRGGFGSTGV